MPGGPDLLYVRARAALLDAAEALSEQLDAVVLVGAQAIYVHTGDADFGATAPYTTDADLCVAPAELSDAPLLPELLNARGFTAGGQPGAWLSPDGIPVDLMVPDALAGPGKRGARLGPHGKRVARRAKGLEGALVDRERMVITSLDPGVERSVAMLVVLRLLQATGTATLAARLVHLADDADSAEVSAEAVSRLAPLFGTPDAVGIGMAIRAARADAEADVISASFTTLVSDLLAAYRSA